MSKKISLWSAVAISATSMVGSGWLFSAQLNARIAGNYAFVAWILAAMLVMAVGICLAQVAAAYPVRGALTRTSSLSHNGIFGMPFAFANWFGITVVVGTEAQATTQYLSSALHSTTLMLNAELTVYGKLLALGFLILYFIINYYGIQVLARINNVITILKIFTPLFTIAIFLIAHFDTTNFHLATNHVYTLSSAFQAIIGAGLIYSYNGFQIAIAYASEIKNPKRNLPLSLIISILIVMCVYMLLQLAFMGAVPHALLSNGWSALNFDSPLMDLSMLLGINFLALLLIADSVVSPSGTGYSYLGGASRMLYGMAVERQVPKWVITKLHPRYNICHRSLLITFLITAIALWNAKNWASLMVIVTGLHLIGYMASPISMGGLKPKTRIFGLIVFILIGLVLTTLGQHDLLLMSSVLSILMIVYGTIRIMHHQISFYNLLIFASPILIYLWLVYYNQNLFFVAIISAILYLFVTHPKYVIFCRQHNATDLLDVEEDKGINLPH